MRRNWSREENLATIQAYVGLLQAEFRGDKRNKAAVERELLARLEGRTKGAVSRKFMNISAVLDASHWKWLAGYKPLSRYQADLAEAIAECIRDTPGLFADAERDADRVPDFALPSDLLGCLEDPPAGWKPRSHAEGVAETPAQVRPSQSLPDLFRREASNHTLGRKGELFVIAFERARLAHLGKNALASKVEHVSVSIGDGLGYDIHSFDDNGRDRLIEVKTTKYDKGTPVFVSANELRVSRSIEPHYHLYRVFRFGSKTALYTLHGALDKVCILEPSTFLGRVR